MAQVRIGYYVHHHGTGHLRTALAIIPHIPHPVVMLSSLPRPGLLPSNVTYVQLDDDAVSGYAEPKDSFFMYTPKSPRTTARFKQILDAISQYKISSIYVDVSMEVALFCKLIGLTVGHNVLVGIRDDPAHDALYAACDYYLSDNTEMLDAFSKRNGPRRLERVGGISRYASEPSKDLSNPKNVLVVMSPKSTQEFTDGLRIAARANPEKTWHILGTSSLDIHEPNVMVHGNVDDPRLFYEAADVVIGGAGHNVIMEAASFNAPFLCIPEDRPYEEQRCAAEALSHANLAVLVDAWPDASSWPQIFMALKNVDRDAFGQLVDDHAAKRAARIISTHC